MSFIIVEVVYNTKDNTLGVMLSSDFLMNLKKEEGDGPLLPIVTKVVEDDDKVRITLRIKEESSIKEFFNTLSIAANSAADTYDHIIRTKSTEVIMDRLLTADNNKIDKIRRQDESKLATHKDGNGELVPNKLS